jgi:hypothetical protein
MPWPSCWLNSVTYVQWGTSKQHVSKLCNIVTFSISEFMTDFFRTGAKSPWNWEYLSRQIRLRRFHLIIQSTNYVPDRIGDKNRRVTRRDVELDKNCHDMQQAARSSLNGQNLPQMTIDLIRRRQKHYRKLTFNGWRKSPLSITFCCCWYQFMTMQAVASSYWRVRTF